MYVNMKIFVSVCTCNTVEVIFDYDVFCEHHVAVVIFAVASQRRQTQKRL